MPNNTLIYGVIQLEVNGYSLGEVTLIFIVASNINLGHLIIEILSPFENMEEKDGPIHLKISFCLWLLLKYITN